MHKRLMYDIGPFFTGGGQGPPGPEGPPGPPGAAQNLQTTMMTGPDAGFTDQVLSVQNAIKVLNATLDEAVALESENVDLNGSSVNIESVSFTGRPGAALQAGSLGLFGSTMILYYRSGADAMFFTGKDIFGTSRQTGINFRSIGTQTNDVAYLSDLPHGNFTIGTFVGVTITIPHGLPNTPTFATIVAKNAASATALVGGYYLTYDSANIVVTLLVNVAVAIALNLDWSALV